MKLLASPRMRRRLGWLAAMLGLVGVIGLLVVLIPGRPDEPEAPLVDGGYVPPEPEVPLRRRNRDLVEPLDVASKFILTAVARKNVGQSWEIISPTFPGSPSTRKSSGPRPKRYPCSRSRSNAQGGDSTTRSRTRSG